MSCNYRALSQKLHELKNCIQNAVVNRVVEDFIDIASPLRQFTEAVLAPEGTPHREQNFADKALNLEQFSNRAAKTARMVAAGGSGGNKKLTEALLTSSNQVNLPPLPLPDLWYFVRWLLRNIKINCLGGKFNSSIDKRRKNQNGLPGIKSCTRAF